jgi:hypothetical protein
MPGAASGAVEYEYDFFLFRVLLNRTPWAASSSSGESSPRTELSSSAPGRASNAVDASVLYDKTEHVPSSSRRSECASVRERVGGLVVPPRRRGASRHRRVPGSPSSELESGSESSGSESLGSFVVV